MDFLLKQRLVGAIVLVALGVIFIPMLLEGPGSTLVPKMEELPEFSDPRSDEPLESFPSADAVPGAPGTAVVMSDPEPEHESVRKQPEPGTEPEAEAAQSRQPEKDSGSAASEVAPVPAPTPVEEPSSKPGPLGSWIVQVGSFSSQQNALVLRDKLRKDGFVTQVEKVTVQGKTHYRVRVGPFLERSEAEQNQRTLSGKFSLKARVLSYP